MLSWSAVGWPWFPSDGMDPLTRLLLDAQAGDRDALDRFVALTYRDVHDLCRYLGDPDTVDDLAQETYQRAVQSLHRYRADGPAKHWLLTIARRTCVDATRKRQRRRGLSLRLSSLADDDLIVPAEAGRRPELADLLHELDDDRREAFVLTQLNSFRYDEAAEMLGVPIGTIRSRVSRAREQLVGLVESIERQPDVDEPPGREPRTAEGRP